VTRIAALAVVLCGACATPYYPRDDGGMTGLDAPVRADCTELSTIEYAAGTQPGGISRSPLGLAGPIVEAGIRDGRMEVTTGLLLGSGLRGTRSEAVVTLDVLGHEEVIWPAGFAYYPRLGERVATVLRGTPGIVVPDYPCRSLCSGCDRTGCSPLSLVIEDPSDHNPVAAISLTERFVGGQFGACNPSLGNLLLLGEQENVGLVRYARCLHASDEGTDVWYRLHVWDTEGREVTPLEGEPAREPIYLSGSFPAVDSVASNDDGELFYGTDRAGLDAGSPPALRVVRRNPDMTLAMVSDPITDPTVHAPSSSGMRPAFGFWGAATADGAYVAHVVAPIDASGVGRSHFVRVERDGSIGWHHTSIGLAARDVDGLCRMMVEHEGGIIALVSDASFEADLRLIRITAAGELVHGAEGIDVAGQVGFDLENRNAWVAVASDGEGGLFVALVGDGAAPFGRGSHISADGRALFGPVEVGSLQSSTDFVELYQAFAVGLGGMWIVQLGSLGLVQHVDATGRPLFALHIGVCSGGGERREYYVLPRDAADAGLDAMSLDDASMSVDPDAGIDASPEDGG